MLIHREELLHEAVVRAIQEHAVEAFPHESCGVILDDGTYMRMRNVAEEPERHAQFPHDELLELLSSGRLRAVVHSHPNGPNCPSGQDMRFQLDLEVPFVIVSTNGEACLRPFAWGDQLVPLPLFGRGFQHAVSDCYELCRDIVFQRAGKRIPQFVRDWEWWQNRQTLYLDGFKEAGFREIDASEVRPGELDFFLAAVRSRTPNHAGLIQRDGLILHHTTGGRPWDPMRLSGNDTAARWRPYVTHWLRYDG